MSGKRFLVGLILVACAGVIFVVVHSVRGNGAEADSEPDEPTVVSVQTTQVRRATLHGNVEGFGRVEAAPAAAGEPAASAQIASAVAGVLMATEVVEGQQVQKGQVLFKLDDRAARVALGRAEQALSYAEATSDRQKKLLAQQNASARSVQEAEARLAAARADLAAAQAQLDLLHITAPLTGTVARINVRPGEAIDLTTVMAEITDPHRLVVSAGIPSGQAAALKPGQTVTVAGKPTVTAKLSFVSPTVDASNDTVLVRAPLPDDSDLHVGQFVGLRIITVDHEDCLAVPVESVVTNANGQEIVAIVVNGEATQTPVKTGLREDGWIEIEGGGIEEGATVVTLGAYGLPPQTKVRVVNP